MNPNTQVLYHEKRCFTRDSWHKADGTLDLEAIRQFLQSMTDEELREARTFLTGLRELKRIEEERNQHRRRGRRRI